MNSKLVIGISSRALFDLSQSHQIFEKNGIEAYRDHQIQNENEILDPGEAFNLVTKILKINELYEAADRIEGNITVKKYSRHWSREYLIQLRLTN
jgi:5'-nucleotidase